ncbi:uncharacterized protein UV8b_05164 [Ustilaginoidea virens]|uniref:GH64 domain-containing protein n=1 Tax=Ustilaginoidea virens TaxID=1159556 RepID=A0A063C9Z6_USTVR|nr:uncharacterized protein UV8b_05164 [Ustilaginoidea virens]QUC20923.1 hypothetical protein UV8b_05164 [Ustilaginoidea virens]GAO20080.1 hypothetical protein UVI_02008160 [Ustilaginoidea virens]
MRCTLSALTALLGAVAAAPSSLLPRARNNGFTIARAGGVDKIIITEDNTLNGTYHDSKSKSVSVSASYSATHMPFQFVNNFGGGQVKAYVTGLDSDDKVVFIKSDGSLYYPSSGGSEVPVEISNHDIAINLPGRDRRFSLHLPIPMHSGRVYFSEGELKFFMVKVPGGDGLVQPSVTNTADPSSETNWGFIEFTYNADGSIFSNISYVDFVGIILSMSLSVKDGAGTQETKGLDGGAVSALCNGLISQSENDGRNWGALCVANGAGEPIRVLSPNVYRIVKPGDFEDYWQAYVDEVWHYYTDKALTIDTQGPAGNVKCRVSGGTMSCDGDNRPYSKPAAADIWGCDSGTFAKQNGDNGVHLAVIPRLCAAFVRSTLLIDQGNVQPRLAAKKYYKVNPTNHYSRLVHGREIDGRGYAFAYDDVNADGENASGTLSSGRPNTLTVYFGGSPS